MSKADNIARQDIAKYLKEESKKQGKRNLIPNSQLFTKEQKYLNKLLEQELNKNERNKI